MPKTNLNEESRDEEEKEEEREEEEEIIIIDWERVRARERVRSPMRCATAADEWVEK